VGKRGHSKHLTHKENDAGKPPLPSRPQHIHFVQRTVSPSQQEACIKKQPLAPLFCSRWRLIRTVDANIPMLSNRSQARRRSALEVLLLSNPGFEKEAAVARNSKQAGRQAAAAREQKHGHLKVRPKELSGSDVFPMDALQ